MKSLIVTDSGNELIARVIAGETTISFTRIAVSDCDYSEIDVKQIKDLQQIKQTVPISKISRLDKNMIEVLAAVENRQVEEAYFVYALGIYAKDSNENEILYGVSLCDENPDYMPAYEGKVLSGISYRLDIVVGDSEQVLLDVNPAAVATTLQVEQIENDLIRHTQDREIHVTEEKQKKWDAVEDKVDKSNIVNNLITTEEGFAADARQLNKSIEDSFAYAINLDLANIKNALSSKQDVPGYSNSKATFKMRYNDITVCLVAARVFTTVAEGTSALWLVTFIQTYMYPKVYEIYKGDKITADFHINGAKNEHYVEASSTYGNVFISITYLC